MSHPACRASGSQLFREDSSGLLESSAGCLTSLFMMGHVYTILSAHIRPMQKVQDVRTTGVVPLRYSDPQVLWLRDPRADSMSDALTMVELP